MKPIERIITYVDQLLCEGTNLCQTKFPRRYATGTVNYVELGAFHKWRGRCRHLCSLLGPHATPWDPVLMSTEKNTEACVLKTIGALEGIKELVQDGMLLRFEDLVLAQFYADLIDQAEYLYSKGFIVPSAVIGRSVLEERLRRLCQVHDCVPSKKRPTINDFNLNLKREDVYDLIMFKNVDALASVGNAAAHGNTTCKDDVRRMLDGIQDFLLRFSV